VSNGALSGSGQQHLGGRLAMLSYVMVSLPLALFLGFWAGLASVGLMAGHAVGKIIHSGASLGLVARIRWDRQSNRAVDRVRAISASRGGESSTDGGSDKTDSQGVSSVGVELRSPQLPADGSACDTLATSGPASPLPDSAMSGRGGYVASAGRKQPVLPMGRLLSGRGRVPAGAIRLEEEQDQEGLG
jgi:hypothetical protein